MQDLDERLIRIAQILKMDILKARKKFEEDKRSLKSNPSLVLSLESPSVKTFLSRKIPGLAPNIDDLNSLAEIGYIRIEKDGRINIMKKLIEANI